MSLQVENLENNMAKLTIEVPAEDLDSAIQDSYNRQKSKITVPGFRKGKVPLAYLEKFYGPGIFYDDAANILIQKAYPEEIDASDLDIVSQPKIEVTQIEKGKPFIFTAEVALKPEVTLGEYKGVKVKAVPSEVTDEDIDARIKRDQQQNSRTVEVTDRPVAKDDTVTIDFDGYVDGEQFDGGKAEDYDLVIGSGSFIDNFEDQLIGKNIGDDVEVNVTFPEDYHVAELKGKPALFKVKIKAIKAHELPEVTDEFVSDVSDTAKTVDEYREEIRKQLQSDKDKEARSKKEDEVIEKIVDDAKMDIPDAMVDAQINESLQEYAQQLQYQGLSLDQYMKYTGNTLDVMKEQMRPGALKRIQSRLVLEAIVSAEGLTATDEEYEDELKKMSEQYQMKLDDVKDVLGDKEKEGIKLDIAVQKAVDLVVDAAVEE